MAGSSSRTSITAAPMPLERCRSVLQADFTRGQSSLHSPLPCLPPSPSLGMPPLPFLPPAFEWVDAVVMPPGKRNRRLLRVRKRRREEAEEGEEEKEEGEEEEGCRCGAGGTDSNGNDSDQVKNGDLTPSCCQEASCPCFRRAHRMTSSSSSSSISTTTTKSSSNDTIKPSSLSSSSSSSSSLSKFEFECSSRCRCPSDHCRLRPTQTPPPPVLQLRCTPGKGWGVFFSPPPALPPSLPAHTFVAEYVGELIGTEEARRRLALYDKQACPPSLPPSLPSAAAHAAAQGDEAEIKEEGEEEEEEQQHRQQWHNYLLTLLEEGPSFLLRTSLDATHKGNVSRFFNHSCAPNLSVVCVRDGGVLPRLCLFTNREVKEGEELTFAYGEGGREGGRVCRCGAGECKGFLPFYPGL